MLLFYVAVAVFCFLAIQRSLPPNGLGAVGPAFGAMRVLDLALSALGVAGFFAMIWILEQFALGEGGAPRQARGLVIAPLAANALSIGVGFGALSGSALRMRLYARAHMASSTAIYVAASVTIMSVLGGCLVAALGCVFGQLHPPTLPAGLMAATPWIGGSMLAALAALVVIAGPGGRKITIFARSLHLPSSQSLALQISVGAVSWLCSVIALYVLLPQGARPPFVEFTTGFVVFQLLALATGSPGGLGVFEAMILSFSAGVASPERVLAALLCYRIMSFVLPIVLGLVGGSLLVVSDRRQRATQH